MHPPFLILAETVPGWTFPVGMEDLRGILPVLILFLTGSIVLGIDLFLHGWTTHSKPGEKLILHFVSLLGTFAAGAAVCASLARGSTEARSYFLDAVRVDPFADAMALLIVLGTFLALLGAIDALRRLDLEHGEFHGLVLYAASAMILFVQANSMVILFLSVETLSMAVYVLTAFARDERRSVEGALKYFMLGAFSSGFLLLGITFVFGATRSLHLSEIVAVLARSDSSPDLPLLLTGLALIVVGLSFKVGAFPFHSWLPDAYEGAPTVVTAFMAMTVKVASVAVLLRIVHLFAAHLSAGQERTAVTALAIISLGTMVFGNLVAILQDNMKRMLAYSAIAHTGYILVGAAAVAALRSAPGGSRLDPSSAAPIVFYLLAYGITSIGAFMAISLLGRGTWEPEQFSDYRGLSSRNPGLALALLVLMISFAGIPPTAGFWSKLYVFRLAIEAGQWELALVGILTSVVSVYYYLRLIVNMYMQPAVGEERTDGRGPSASAIVVGACAVAIVIIGLMPSPFFRLSEAWSLFP